MMEMNRTKSKGWLLMEQRFLELAISLAKQDVVEKGGRPFGAIVVKNGEIIATGTNDVLETMDPSAHAEMVAY
jgi:tRNA(Arg) A34 adenosine deaminase TadA